MTIIMSTCGTRLNNLACLLLSAKLKYSSKKDHKGNCRDTIVQYIFRSTFKETKLDAGYV